MWWSEHDSRSWPSPSPMDSGDQTTQVLRPGQQAFFYLLGHLTHPQMNSFLSFFFSYFLVPKPCRSRYSVCSPVSVHGAAAGAGEPVVNRGQQHHVGAWCVLPHLMHSYLHLRVTRVRPLSSGVLSPLKDITVHD